MTTYVITMCFNRPDIIMESLAQCRATIGDIDYRHILIDNYYPLPNKADNHRTLCKLHGTAKYEVLDAGRNLGLHGGFNWACAQLPLKDDDIVIGYDPDSYPVTNGWGMALITAIKFGGNVAWASLMNPISRRELTERGFTPRKINQLVVWETHKPCVNSICAWPWEFLRRAGGLKEPNAFYGGLECALWADVNHQNKKWVYIDGYWEESRYMEKQDAHYRDYKWHHAHTGKWPGDFDSYLISQGVKF